MQYSPTVPPAPPVPATGPAAPASFTEHRRMGEKFRLAVLSAVAFAVLAFPGTFRVVELVWAAITNIPNQIVTEFGCATPKGVFVHALVFFAVMLYIL